MGGPLMGQAVRTLAGYAVVLVTLVLNAAFVAAEFALVAADRRRIDGAVEQGSRRASTVQGMFKRLTFHLSGAQLGVTITSILLGFLAEPLLADTLRRPVEAVVGASLVHPFSLALSLALATVLQLIFAELVPKNVAVARPESTALLLSGWLRAFDAFFAPLIGAIDRAANRLTRLVGVEPVEELDDVPTLDELAVLVRTSGEEGMLAPDATRLLSRTLRFADKTASEAMVPRLDVVALPIDGTVADLTAAVRAHGYSRYPVFDRDLDHLIGVVHAKDVYRITSADRSGTSLGAMATPIVVVPESHALDEVLVLLRGGRQLAVVVDEYGGTAGIVTLEDVLEELVGEIDDEHDRPEPAVSGTATVAADVFDLDAGLHVDEVAEACGLVLPDGPYETLAGFVLVQLDRIPVRGDAFVWEGWTIQVAEMERRRIARVLVQRPLAPARTPEDAG